MQLAQGSSGTISPARYVRPMCMQPRCPLEFAAPAHSSWSSSSWSQRGQHSPGRREWAAQRSGGHSTGQQSSSPRRHSHCWQLCSQRWPLASRMPGSSGCSHEPARSHSGQQRRSTRGESHRQGILSHRATPARHTQCVQGSGPGQRSPSVRSTPRWSHLSEQLELSAHTHEKEPRSLTHVAVLWHVCVARAHSSTSSHDPSVAVGA